MCLCVCLYSEMEEVFIFPQKFCANNLLGSHFSSPLYECRQMIWNSFAMRSESMFSHCLHFQCTNQRNIYSVCFFFVFNSWEWELTFSFPNGLCMFWGKTLVHQIFFSSKNTFLMRFTLGKRSLLISCKFSSKK